MRHSIRSRARDVGQRGRPAVGRPVGHRVGEAPVRLVDLRVQLPPQRVGERLALGPVERSGHVGQALVRSVLAHRPARGPRTRRARPPRTSRPRCRPGARRGSRRTASAGDELRRIFDRYLQLTRYTWSMRRSAGTSATAGSLSGPFHSTCRGGRPRSPSVARRKAEAVGPRRGEVRRVRRILTSGASRSQWASSTLAIAAGRSAQRPVDVAHAEHGETGDDLGDLGAERGH